MSPRYTIGGIGLRVDQQLPGLPINEYADADLNLQFVDDSAFDMLDSEQVRVIGGPGDLTGAIDPESRMCWLPSISADPTDRAWHVRQIAPVFSAVIERLVLHASAINRDGRVVAFVGESGAGKSTIARLIADLGFPQVSDDLLAVRFSNGVVVPVDGGFLPLGVICFLSRNDSAAQRVARLGQADAFRLLIANGFGEHGDPLGWQFQFDAYHRITQEVPTLDVVIPDDIAALPAGAATVLDHVAVMQSSVATEGQG